MIALQLTSLKTFMVHLLTRESFDEFLLEEAIIRTSTTFSIDGHINKDFYPPEERTAECIPYELQPWSEIRGLCFSLIKGKHTPSYFRFVLHVKPAFAKQLLGSESLAHNISLPALVVTIRYDGTKATLITGTCYHDFVLDKEADRIWDKTIQRFLREHTIPYELAT